MQKFLIIGLGRFGKSVLKELHNLGNDVVGCDENMDVFDEVEKFSSYLVEGDSTDESVLDEINVTDFNHVIVSIGDNFEASILTVTKLKNMGCKSIIAKANDSLRAQALKAVGATEVILPEEEAGFRLANRISTPGFLDKFNIGPNCSAVEVTVPEPFIGKNILEIDLRKKYKVTLISINREGVKYPIISPDPKEVLVSGDTIYIVGENKNIDKLRKKYFD